LSFNSMVFISLLEDWLGVLLVRCKVLATTSMFLQPNSYPSWDHHSSSWIMVLPKR